MDKPGFRDHFSTQASDYASYRPVYPPALFHYLASQTPVTRLAWDCATGSGQGARGLAMHFDRVIATDASAAQIRHATAHAGIEYRVAPAENSGLESGSVNLVTVAQAIHWFDRKAFFHEVERVLKPGGILAIWSYDLFSISRDIDPIIQTLYEDILGQYWPAERRLVENHYRDIRLPFPESTCPEFSMESRWTHQQLLGYLGTWSAVQTYREKNGRDPLALISDALLEAWSAPEVPRAVVWPLTLRVASPLRE